MRTGQPLSGPTINLNRLLLINSRKAERTTGDVPSEDGLLTLREWHGRPFKGHDIDFAYKSDPKFSFNVQPPNPLSSKESGQAILCHSASHSLQNPSIALCSHTRGSRALEAGNVPSWVKITATARSS